MASNHSVIVYGMGVLGREVLRECTQYGVNVKLAADENITYENLLYLLKYDSVYHGWAEKVVDLGGLKMQIDGVQLYFTSDEPQNWDVDGGEILIDCTGKLNSQQANDLSFMYGFRIISLYKLGNDVKVVCYGVNDSNVSENDLVICTGTVEDQVGALMLNLLHEHYGVESAYINAFTSYANSQQTIDSLSVSTDYAQGRAGAWNISPLETSIGKSVSKIVPAINARVVGRLYRAPVINGGAMVIDCVLAKAPDTDATHNLNATLTNAIIKDVKNAINAQSDQLVSSDVLSFDQFQFITDATFQTFETHCSVTVLYDNIRGLALQAIRLINKLIQNNIW